MHRSGIRKAFPAVTAVTHWNRLLIKAVAAPSLEAFKARLDGALATWSGERYPCPWQGPGKYEICNISSKSNHAVVLFL